MRDGGPFGRARIALAVALILTVVGPAYGTVCGELAHVVG
jgi:hypothetical protein